MKISDFVFQNDFIEYKEVLAAQGVKIAAKDLEKVIAGKFLIYLPSASSHF
jgi:translation initiation factor IF-2